MRCFLVRVRCLSTLTLRVRDTAWHGVDVTTNKSKYKLNHRKSMRHEERYTHTILILNWRRRRQSSRTISKYSVLAHSGDGVGNRAERNFSRIIQRDISTFATWKTWRFFAIATYLPSKSNYQKIRMCKRTKVLTGTEGEGAASAASSNSRIKTKAKTEVNQSFWRYLHNLFSS